MAKVCNPTASQKPAPKPKSKAKAKAKSAPKAKETEAPTQCQGKKRKRAGDSKSQKKIRVTEASAGDDQTFIDAMQDQFDELKGDFEQEAKSYDDPAYTNMLTQKIKAIVQFAEKLKSKKKSSKRRSGDFGILMDGIDKLLDESVRLTDICKIFIQPSPKFEDIDEAINDAADRMGISDFSLFVFQKRLRAKALEDLRMLDWKGFTESTFPEALDTCDHEFGGLLITTLLQKLVKNLVVAKARCNVAHVFVRVFVTLRNSELLPQVDLDLWIGYWSLYCQCLCGHLCYPMASPRFASRSTDQRPYARVWLVRSCRPRLRPPLQG